MLHKHKKITMTLHKRNTKSQSYNTNIKESNSYCTRTQLFLMIFTLKSACLTGTLMPLMVMFCHTVVTLGMDNTNNLLLQSLHRKINCRHCQLTSGLQVNGEKITTVPLSLQENFSFLFTSLCCYSDKIQNYV